MIRAAPWCPLKNEYRIHPETLPCLSSCDRKSAMGGRALLQDRREAFCGSGFEFGAASPVIQEQSRKVLGTGGTGGDYAGALSGTIQVGFARARGRLALAGVEGVVAGIV